MFVNFFYSLRDHGIPVSPTSFLRLHKALNIGQVLSLKDLYIVARSTLVKSERYFDSYDQIFAHYFEGAEMPAITDLELDEIARALLEEWLKNPAQMADALGLDESKLRRYTPEELVQYFLDRLKEQTKEHHGGDRWIGTGGTSPVGHGGVHPGGMRVGGSGGSGSAIKVALERRYRDYSQQGPLTQAQIGEALKKLRRMIPSGPRDVVNVDKTIYETMRNAGEIEIIFDKRLKDKLKVVLMIDNGGWSMDPYVHIVQVLFDYARDQFKEVKTYYFHNTIYEQVWKDHTRYKKPKKIITFPNKDPESRIVIVGDASMAPYELMYESGSIYFEERKSKASIDNLKFLAKNFRHAVWLNPRPRNQWSHTWTLEAIQEVFPMFELTLDGLDKAVNYLMLRN
ncbi:MAG: hypothetical protein U9R24_00365 [Thermodesulfobacteriota bacterium]|nr:hypothetical protein [Thermodesulfobacteriota bacterium]